MMRRRVLPALILGVYIAILIKLIVFKDVEIRTPWIILKLGGDYAKGQANFVPFKTIFFYLRGGRGLFDAILNLGGNTVPFGPVGFLVPMLYRKMNWPKALALAASVGLAMEGMEVMFGVGIFDVDDVILNALGVAIGYWVFTLSAKWKMIVIAIGAALAVIVMITLLPIGKRRGPAIGPPGGPPRMVPATAPSP